MSPAHPPLDSLRRVTAAAQNFLRQLAAANLLEGVAGTPLDRNTTILRGTAAFWALAELEHVLNPRRLPFDHTERRTISARGYPDPLLAEVVSTFTAVRDGLDAVLALWKVEGLCGAESYTMGGTLEPGCQSRPGHVHFDLPPDWQRPVSESVAAPFAGAVNRLASLVNLIEAWECGTAPLASLQTAPGRVIDVTGLSCKLVAGTQPTVCPSADPVVPHSQLRRVAEVIRGACRLPPGVTVHWVGHETGTRNGCRCHPDAPFAAPYDQRRAALLFEAPERTQSQPTATAVTTPAVPVDPVSLPWSDTPPALWQPVADQFHALAADPAMKPFLCLIRLEPAGTSSLEAGDRFALQKAGEVCASKVFSGYPAGREPDLERFQLAEAADGSVSELVWFHDRDAGRRGVERYSALAAQAAALVPTSVIPHTELITKRGVACAGRALFREVDRWTWLVLRVLHSAGLLRSQPFPEGSGEAFWFAGTAFEASAAVFRLGGLSQRMFPAVPQSGAPEIGDAGKTGRPPDPTKQQIVMYVQELREKNTPWKSIPGAVFERFKVRYTSETLRGYLKSG